MKTFKSSYRSRTDFEMPEKQQHTVCKSEELKDLIKRSYHNILLPAHLRWITFDRKVKY